MLRRFKRHENSRRAHVDQQERNSYDSRTSIHENGHRESKCDTKRSGIINFYKPLNENDFLSKTHSEIRQEFRKIPNPPAKDTHVAKYEYNLDKSRYRDVIPGESTRVKLEEDSDDENEFINANYVSGYNNQEKAYIFTQGPLQTTIKDFWRMVWQENIAIIVMTTNIREAGILKCFPYWPMQSNEILNAGLYQIQNEKSEKFDSFVVTTLILRKKNHSDNRTIYHTQYLKWPDHGIPSNTKDALLFLDKVEHYRQITMTKAPILLHCSAGIGRTGTFCAVDIGIKRYLEKKITDIPSTVIKMRTERAGSVQTEDQYLFVHLALMDYIKQQQALQERINEPIKSPETDLIDKSDEKPKIKDNNGLNEIDNSIRKTSRSKTNRKKSNDLEHVNIPPMSSSGKTTYPQEPTTYRGGKTLSDSSASAVQYLTPSTPILQSEPNRQRSVTEHISSTPTTTGNVHHKKARK
jgi:protein tyrosine phosphatase